MPNLSSTMLFTTTQRNLSERESAKCTSTRVEMEKKKKPNLRKVITHQSSDLQSSRSGRVGAQHRSTGKQHTLLLLS